MRNFAGKFLAITAIILIFMTTALYAEAGLKIVEDEESEFSILHSKNAPSSVKQAATELQSYIYEATSANLLIEISDEIPEKPFICLGEHKAAEEAGIAYESEIADGYRIVANDGNLYIIGMDTGDGKTLFTGGTSSGTRNGVYTFLEDYLNVKWLYPGRDGDYVEKRDDLILEKDIDRTDKPGFLRRRLPVIQDKLEAVELWAERQKLGSSVQLSHSHNWDSLVPPELWQEHPEWFAMIDGERPDPEDQQTRSAGHHYTYKLETTNPELVKYVAEKIKDAFRENPDMYGYSISPTDGGLDTWSQSPEAKKFWEKNYRGNWSITPLVIDFYNKVAKIVGEEFPDRVLSGYIYDVYLYPPNAGLSELEPNLYLFVACDPSYGFRQYQDWAKKAFDNTVPVWGKALTKAGYYDLPNKIIQNKGAINPPGIEILQRVFPVLGKHYESLYIYGIASWSHGALANYLLAGLMWDPFLDIEARADEFYRYAYGPNAGPIMKEIYQGVESRLKAYYSEHSEAKYKLTNEIIKNVYAEQYHELEDLYLRALAVAEGDYKARVQKFGTAMIMLRWNLVNLGMIVEDPFSPLHRTDEGIDDMINTAEGRMLLAPNPDFDSPHIAEYNYDKLMELTEQLKDGKGSDTIELRGSSFNMAIYAEKDTIALICDELIHDGESPRVLLRNRRGDHIRWYVLREGRKIYIETEPQQPYLITVETTRSDYSLKFEGAKAIAYE